MSPAIPSHVPRELVVDFDFMNLPGHRDDVHVALKRAVENARWPCRSFGMSDKQAKCEH